MDAIKYSFGDIPVTVITKADLEVQATVARRMSVPPFVAGYGVENPRWPWEPCIWREYHTEIDGSLTEMYDD